MLIGLKSPHKKFVNRDRLYGTLNIFVVFIFVYWLRYLLFLLSKCTSLYLLSKMKYFEKTSVSATKAVIILAENLKVKPHFVEAFDVSLVSI